MIIVQGSHGWPAACTCGGGHAKPDHGAEHAEGPEPILLPPRWNVPPSVHAELSQLCKMAEQGNAPTATIGAAQALLLVLLTALPKPIKETPKPRKKGCLAAFLALFEDTGPPPPEKPLRIVPKDVLKKAFEDGQITFAMLEASEKLPLEPAADITSGSSKGRPFVCFLIELADVIHAQPARMA